MLIIFGKGISLFWVILLEDAVAAVLAIIVYALIDNKKWHIYLFLKNTNYFLHHYLKN
jgi:hypothetical protein